MNKYLPILAILLLTPSTALAQFYPIYNTGTWCVDWTCYQQKPQRQTEPKRRHRSSPKKVTKVSSETPKKPQSKAPQKVKIVYRDRSWQNLSEDDAREWIKGQAQTFCGRYPKDIACPQQEKKE